MNSKTKKIMGLTLLFAGMASSHYAPRTKMPEVKRPLRDFEKLPEPSKPFARPKKLSRKKRKELNAKKGGGRK